MSDIVVLTPQTRSEIVTRSDCDEVALCHDGSPPEVMRQRIDDLVQRMLTIPTAEKKELRVEHVIEDGMYMRKLFIPKDTVLAGKIHLKSCLNIVASGDITVLTEFGLRRCSAGFTGVSQRGMQKVGHAHADTIFINVFRTDNKDLDSIEAEIAGIEHVHAVETEMELLCL